VEVKVSCIYLFNARHPDVLLKTIKIYKYRQNTTKIYYTLPLLDYVFRLLGVIIRSSSGLWDPVALTIVGAIVLWVHICYCSVYGYIFRETKINNQINDRQTIKPTEGNRLPTSTQIATLDPVLQGLHLCPNGKELCDGKKHHPKVIQPLL